IHSNVGVIEMQTGHPAEAVASYQLARAVLEPMASAHPGDAKVIQSLSAIHYNIALLQAEHAQCEEALSSYEPARALREQLVREYPEAPEYAHELARTYN